VGIITVTDLAKHLRTTLLIEGVLSGNSDSWENEFQIFTDRGLISRY
jgi:hypothetical protein